MHQQNRYTWIISFRLWDIILDGDVHGHVEWIMGMMVAIWHGRTVVHLGIVGRRRCVAAGFRIEIFQLVNFYWRSLGSGIPIRAKWIATIDHGVLVRRFLVWCVGLFATKQIQRWTGVSVFSVTFASENRWYLWQRKYEGFIWWSFVLLNMVFHCMLSVNCVIAWQLS